MHNCGSLTRFAHDLQSPDASRREEAARQIWLRFADRLGALVGRRLDVLVRRRVDVDDVVQSLFASFFAAKPSPAGPPRSREDLWRLLVHFAMCKVAGTVDHHHARRRDVRRDRPFPLHGDAETASDEGWAALRDRARMTPADEVVARLEFERLLAVLPDDLRQTFALRLEGYTNAEIAAQIGRVERTVELKLRTIRGLLRPHLAEMFPSRPDAADHY
jgi:RNA polymerase sigma-70 factor, ECF subfamily